MAINPTSFPMPAAFSGGVDFSPLANLGNVYRQGQMQDATRQTLAQLGPDPVANTQFLIKSGVPELVQAGVKMQSDLATRAEDVRQFNLAQQVREGKLKLEKEAAEADTPEYRQKQLDTAIAAGKLPPEAAQDPSWQAYIQTGQKVALQRPELTAKEQGFAEDADKRYLAARTTLDSIARMKELNKTAWSGYAGGLAPDVAKALPEGITPQGVIDAQEYANLAKSNIAGNAKAAFGNRITNQDLKLLQDIETSPSMNAAERRVNLENLEKRIQLMQDQAEAESKGIRQRTYFKPGGGTLPAPAGSTAAPGGTTTAAPAAPAGGTALAKPTLKEFMERARADPRNANVPDSELAAHWKKNYGG
jgi:hypothetical protein